MRVTLVAATAIYEEALREATGEAWWTPDNQALRRGATDAEILVEGAGRICYASWDNPIRRSTSAYVAHLIEQEHWSVLEHATATVVIQGISRACSHELVRHRHLSFSQRSQRFVNERGEAMVMPPLFDRGELVWEQLYDEAMTRAMESYQRLLAVMRLEEESIGRTERRKRLHEAARAVLPNACATELFVTANHRAWYEFLKKRGQGAADLEMRGLAYALWEALRPLVPTLYETLQWERDGLGVWQLQQRKEE